LKWWIRKFVEVVMIGGFVDAGGLGRMVLGDCLWNWGG